MKGIRGKRNLSLQTLESRHLLAAATFSLQLYESTENGPGEEIVADQIHVGDSFYVEISAIEHDTFHRGIGAVALNLQWDPENLSLVEQDFDLEQILHPDLPLFRAGTFDQAAGRIYDLRASQIEAIGAGQPVGDGEIATVATLHFEALEQASDTNLRLWEGASGIAPVPYARWQRDAIEFETKNLTIQPTAAQRPASADTAEVRADVESSEDEFDFVVETPVDQPQSDTSSKSSPTGEAPADTPPVENAPIDTPPVDTPPVDNGNIDTATKETSVTTASVAESVDEVLSFDLNRDGIFDLADFGFLNLDAAALRIEATSTESANQPTANAESESSDQLASPLESSDTIIHHVCTAAPHRSDVVAFESWLDSLAQAWLDDADDRERRRRAALES